MPVPLPETASSRSHPRGRLSYGSFPYMGPILNYSTWNISENILRLWEGYGISGAPMC